MSAKKEHRKGRKEQDKRKTGSEVRRKKCVTKQDFSNIF
jgi:hypothetical protein